MSADRADAARYFRQLAELGVADVFLDDMTARDALTLASGRMPATYAAAALPAAAPLAAAAASTAASGAASPAPTVGADGVGAAALEALRLHALAEGGCSGCTLREQRTNLVFGEGNAAADVVVVGEAPGQEEDRTGRPFVGRAGKLLDLLLLTCGFPREDVYICNVLKCRPPQNRDPLPAEVASCTSSFLHGQLEAIAPRVLLAVGRFAAQSLLQTEENITRLRGRVHSYRGTPLIVTYHPAYLLRSPQMTRIAWQDFQLLRRVLDEQV